MDSDDAEDEVFSDNETGYNGVAEPVRIEEIDHTIGPAVILGALRQNGHVIRAEGMGLLVVETAPPRNGKPHA